MRRFFAWQGALALAAALAAFAAGPARAAVLTSVPTPDSPFYGGTFATPVEPGTKMLVESDQLVYDYDNHSVAAVGNVRIYYGQYTLTGDKVTYDETSGRLVADGHVRLVDPTGNAFNTTHVDITSNFRDAFVASLEVDTPQQTHFLADSATRTDGNTMTFVNGSYTACEICEEQPQKPPLWNVKATKIIVDQTAQTVSFTDAELQFLGAPVAWIPYFTIADPSVTRQTGFLWPKASYSTRLGLSASIPYFWAISPSKDLTVTPTAYSRQGFLGEAEWRQRLANGVYSIDVAGISQQDRSAFDAGSPADRDLRGGVHTVGSFDINARWNVGWDATLLSDRTFTRDYPVLSTSSSPIVSTVALQGLGDRNYFNAHASAYQVLTETSAAPATNLGKFDQGRQAVAIPVIDYTRVNGNGPGGGQVTATSNLTSLVRTEDDPLSDTLPYYAGTAGTTVRATQELAWQRQTIGSMGQVVTPFAYVRGDAYFLNFNTAAPNITGNSTALRAMPAAGVDVSLPLLVRNASASQIISPEAQFILRPNEMGIGTVPNNDAQSLVYEASNLFDWDKFTGFDRTEGGSRLNLGLHYTGSFASGAAITGIFGQSYQLLGLNSYAVADVANVGPNSGLGTRASDYVGSLSLDTGVGPSVAMSGRFDDKTFAVNRAELEATAALGPVTASAAYFYLRQNPDAAMSGPASVVHAAASLNLTENWRAFGSFAYDVAKSAVASNSFGIAFDNSCLTFAVTYNQTLQNYSDLPDRAINFRLELRTLGAAQVSANLNTL